MNINSPNSSPSLMSFADLHDSRVFEILLRPGGSLKVSATDVSLFVGQPGNGCVHRATVDIFFGGTADFRLDGQLSGEDYISSADFLTRDHQPSYIKNGGRIAGPGSAHLLFGGSGASLHFSYTEGQLQLIEVDAEFENWPSDVSAPSEDLPEVHE